VKELIEDKDDAQRMLRVDAALREPVVHVKASRGLGSEEEWYAVYVYNDHLPYTLDTPVYATTIIAPKDSVKRQFYEWIVDNFEGMFFQQMIFEFVE
jgi:hypothetical protein